MKKYYLLIFALLFMGIGTASAQFKKYYTFPDSNAVWCEDSINASCGTGGYQTFGYNFVLNGDTIVNGLNYHKVYLNRGYWSDNCSLPGFTVWFYSYSFFGAYREDTMKHIYACCTPYLGSHDSLLYDFNMKVGDTLKQFNARSMVSPQPYTVYSIDSVMVGSAYRKRFNLDINSDTAIGHIPSIIEGIGSTQGLFNFMCEPFEIYSELNCFSQNNVKLYGYDSCSKFYLGMPELEQTTSTVSLYPNPNKGVFAIQSSVNSRKSLVEIYNMLGEKVYQQFSIPNSPFSINISGQPSGVYLYRVIAENGTIVGEDKFIIQ